MSIAPSGEQFQISADEHRATIVEVGGGVREHTVSESMPSERTTTIWSARLV